MGFDDDEGESQPTLAQQPPSQRLQGENIFPEITQQHFGVVGGTPAGGLQGLGSAVSQIGMAQPRDPSHYQMFMTHFRPIQEDEPEPRELEDYKFPEKEEDKKPPAE
jgi:hypothetical protein